MDISIGGIRPLSPDTSAATTKDPKAGMAASQFESLLIAQMLKSMRESESGWLGTGEDSASDSAMAMAEEHFATAISKAGGLGLAKLVKTGLEAPNLGSAVHLGSTKSADAKP